MVAILLFTDIVFPLVWHLSTYGMTPLDYRTRMTRHGKHSRPGCHSTVTSPKRKYLRFMLGAVLRRLLNS